MKGIQIGRHRLVLGIGLLALASGAVFWGRTGVPARATARQPESPPARASQTPQPQVSSAPAMDSKLAVAYIYDSIPITREKLGEYLIARMGEDRLEALVNKLIIEHVCQARGITVTPAEVVADLTETLHGLQNMTPKDFVSKMLKPYHKTLYEWEEDVIKPRILLTKLCRDRIHVTDDDVRQAYDAAYGEKVICRIIMWPPSEHGAAMRGYNKIRSS